MTTSGTKDDWALARRLRKQLQKLRSDEEVVSGNLDLVVGRLSDAGNSGYAIAQELGMERPTVARILRRANGE
jgi:hypothetical protein